MTEPPATTAPAIATAIAAAAARQISGQTHDELGALLRAAIDGARRAAMNDYARGDVAAARFCAFFDDALRALFDAGASQHQGAAKSVALVAIGGYGAGKLAPYSDVDLLFLVNEKDAAFRPLLDFVLYPLWDAGVRVGHAVHDPRAAIEASRQDLVKRTALLDARFIAGAKPLFADLQRRFDTLRKRTKKAFRTAKLVELDERQQRSSEALFLAEPDIKEGKGGIRDLQTIGWIHLYELESKIGAAKAPNRLFAPDEAQAFHNCERFLWSVRLQLHAAQGRAEDRLTFNVQPAVAERMGYADRAGLSASERLMKDYFVNALEIGRLVRIFRARLDEMEFALSRRALQTLPKSLLTDEAGPKANLKLWVGRLQFDNVARARARPVDLFRFFRAHSRRPEFDPHPDALAVIAAAAKLVGPDSRKDETIARLFLATLVDARRPGSILRLMAETGLLGRYLPSIAKITGQVEYGLHRRYSIDESVYQSLDVLAEIARGEEASRHPIATRILAAAPTPAPFFLAVLLHETRWSLRTADPVACARLVTQIAARLGRPAAEAALIGWSAAAPLLLVDIAERRNLADASSIMDFARKVAEQEKLDLLLVLAVCHLRIVGRNSWDEWKRRQIAELYDAASAFLAGGESAVEARLLSRSGEARLAVQARLENWKRAERDALIAIIGEDVFRLFDPATIARVAELARGAADDGAVAIEPRGDFAEAIVYAKDRPGLFADLAGAIASTGVSVRAAHAATAANGRIVDVFQIQPVGEGLADDPELLRKLHARLLAAAHRRPSEPPAPARRIGDRRALFRIEPIVRFDANASAACTIMEIECRDRPGLLRDLAGAITESGAAIRSAHIATHGARAIDAFYLQEETGEKIVSKRRWASIEKRVLAAIASGEEARTPLPQGPAAASIDDD